MSEADFAEFRAEISELRKSLGKAQSRRWLPAGVNMVAVLIGCLWLYDAVDEFEDRLWRYEILIADRLTGSMLIEAHDELMDRNKALDPKIQWLDAQTVRRIQRGLYPIAPRPKD